MNARKKAKMRTTKPPKLPPFRGEPNEARWTSHTSVNDLRDFAADLQSAERSLLGFLAGHPDNAFYVEVARALGRVSNVKSYLEVELRLAEKQLAGGAS